MKIELELNEDEAQKLLSHLQSEYLRAISRGYTQYTVRNKLPPAAKKNLRRTIALLYEKGRILLRAASQLERGINAAHNIRCGACGSVIEARGVACMTCGFDNYIPINSLTVRQAE